ncbi:hypothetical protein Y032_0623g772 [Ancylostoma ceylanicum]|uniref:Uncharacterized protein n=1 Tax=Ancylostoma ceylanicum TaxID=53326 RepID=A0A016WKS2_9BILA|nr:hypothetical protein Y032_0623g772 [Ancylostoma ceylanicum]
MTATEGRSNHFDKLWREHIAAWSSLTLFLTVRDVWMRLMRTTELSPLRQQLLSQIPVAMIITRALMHR